MDITVSKEDLNSALAVTQSIVDRKHTNPILVNLLLSVLDGELKVSASDLETSAISRCKAEVRKNGSIAVNAKVFTDLVRELPEGEIQLVLGEADRVDLIAGSVKSKMIGISADNFPDLPGIDLVAENKMSAKIMAGMLSSTLYAVSTDETRFNLNGVCFSTSKDGSTNVLKMVATDGHRLALVSHPCGKLSLNGNFIVPRKGLTEAKRLLSELGDVDIGLGIEKGFFLLDVGRTKFSMRLVDGEFPDYSQVIPKDKGTATVVSSAELNQALKLVSVMSTDKNKCVRLDFSPGALRISASSSELGDASEVLEVDYTGEPISIGFNSRYLQDFTTSVGEDQRICLENHGVLGPARLFLENDESSFGIVMPMRLA